MAKSPKPNINKDLVKKIVGMMFSEFENERHNALSLFIRTVKNAGIPPSDIKFLIYSDKTDLEEELDEAWSEIEERLDEIADLRHQIEALEKASQKSDNSKEMQNLRTSLEQALDKIEVLEQSLADLANSATNNEKEYDKRIRELTKKLEKAADASDKTTIKMLNKKLADAEAKISEQALQLQQARPAVQTQSIIVKKPPLWKRAKGGY